MPLNSVMQKYSSRSDAKTFEAYCTTMFCRCCRRLLCFLIQKFFIHKNNIAIGSKYLPIFFMGHYFLSTTNQMKSLLRFEMYYVF